MKTPDTEAERRRNNAARLAQDIDTATELLALWDHPAVKEWFSREEKRRVEEMLAAPGERLESCRARVNAIRELADLFRGMGSARSDKLRRLEDLRKYERANHA